MMPVTLAAEPGIFESQVRRRGKEFISKVPFPTNKQYKKKNFWSAVTTEIHAAYSGICAYTCFYLASPWSIDHFERKETHPHLAYEWSNYRLCSPRVNNYKANNPNLYDPAKLEPNWFILDFPSCLVRLGPSVPYDKVEILENTLRFLKINDDDFFVQERCDIMMLYADGSVTLQFLNRRYPFLAQEITRKNLQGSISTLLRRLP
jgi:hypothetical protein